MTSHLVPPLHRLSIIMLLWIIFFAGFCAANGEEAQPPKKKYTCPTNFVRHGNSCYFFSSHMATWFEAHFACRDLNSELAILEKGWEDRNMRTYLNKPELARLERWIGGIYNWETKRWVWGANGGNSLKYQGFSQMSKDHEPRWNCIIMDPAMMYKWSGRLCIDKKHYICEVPLKKIQPSHPHANEPPRKPKKGKDNWKMKKPRDPSRKRKDPNRRLNDLQRQQRLQRKGRRQRQQLRRQQAPRPHPLNTTVSSSGGIPYQNQNLHEQAQPYVNWSNYHKYRYLRVPEISYQEKVLLGK